MFRNLLVVLLLGICLFQAPGCGKPTPARSVDESTSQAGYWKKQGAKFVLANNFPQALACFDQALKIDPNNIRYWNIKARNLMILKQYPKALECCEKALRLNPESAENWELKAACWYKLGRKAQALQCLERAESLKAGKTGR